MNGLMSRTPSIRHCTSEPLRFFGRDMELSLLDAALQDGEPSVVAFVGPGGQGKTAIVQHWLQRQTSEVLKTSEVFRGVDGLFLWSFYRGKDSDLCLRELFAYAERLATAPEVSASFCVDRLVPRLRRERWALVLDGTEVVQHESGSWQGRFVHPELGRLLEELASEPMPGVVAVTSRFSLPTLTTRRHARILSLATLDRGSAIALLESLGVNGTAADLEGAAQACGLHAKAVELLGTWLREFHGGAATQFRTLPDPTLEGGTDEERHVARILAAFQDSLTQEQKDILALATAFRQPPTEARLLDYLGSDSVRHLLHDTRQRTYVPWARRSRGWIAAQVQALVDLRLLERVGRALTAAGDKVIDAHPLVRRGFENALGAGHHGAQTRAGFLRGRPDRRPPATLEDAREEVELFYAFCDAGLWNEADSTFVALDNPKHRFLAPAFERDLLLRFFPNGDWRRPPLWPGFGRWRSLAICHEMLGQFEDALALYRPEDAALRGDALVARGRLEPLLAQPQAAAPWQTLWQAYRAHALCLAGRTEEALALASSAVPVDVYEWVHLFECWLRLKKLAAVDLDSLLFRPALSQEHIWSALARRRMRADYLRATGAAAAIDLDAEYRDLLEQYDRAGLPIERMLTRLGYGSWLVAVGRLEEAETAARGTAELAERFGVVLYEIDAWELLAQAAARRQARADAEDWTRRAQERRLQVGYRGPGRQP